MKEYAAVIRDMNDPGRPIVAEVEFQSWSVTDGKYYRNRHTWGIEEGVDLEQVEGTIKSMNNYIPRTIVFSNSPRSDEQ